MWPQRGFTKTPSKPTRCGIFNSADIHTQRHVSKGSSLEMCLLLLPWREQINAHVVERAVCTLTPRLTSPSKNTPNCNEKIAKYQEGIISTSSAGTLYFAPEADIASHTANATSSPARKMWSCVQSFRHPANATNCCHIIKPTVCTQYPEGWKAPLHALCRN